SWPVRGADGPNAITTCGGSGPAAAAGAAPTSNAPHANAMGTNRRMRAAVTLRRADACTDIKPPRREGPQPPIDSRDPKLDPTILNFKMEEWLSAARERGDPILFHRTWTAEVYSAFATEQDTTRLATWRLSDIRPRSSARRSASISPIARARSPRSRRP